LRQPLETHSKSPGPEADCYHQKRILFKVTGEWRVSCTISYEGTSDHVTFDLIVE
jgi:hypothetical protein